MAKAHIDIGHSKRILCNFLLLPISSFDVILGMPFILIANIILRPGSGNATFGNSNSTIKYAAIGELPAAKPIIIIPETVDTEDQNTDTTKLELLDTIRRTAKAAIDTLDASKQEEAHDYVEEMLVTTMKIFNQ